MKWGKQSIRQKELDYNATEICYILQYMQTLFKVGHENSVSINYLFCKTEF